LNTVLSEIGVLVSVVTWSGTELVGNSATGLAVVTIGALARSGVEALSVTVVTRGAQSAVFESFHARILVVVAHGAVGTFKGPTLTVFTLWALVLLRILSSSITVEARVTQTSWRVGTWFSTEATLGAGSALT
jgi:hypothetical protein